MRPKFIVYCLSAICLAFGFKGLFLTENIQNTLKRMLDNQSLPLWRLECALIGMGSSL